MLARDGFAAIWVLHLSAARASREGRKAAATAIIEIADAAEREWLRRGNRTGSSRRLAPIRLSLRRYRQPHAGHRWQSRSVVEAARVRGAVTGRYDCQ